jgi:hypothetical protein
MAAFGQAVSGCSQKVRRAAAIALTGVLTLAIAQTTLTSPFFAVAELLYSDDFSNGLARWTPELEQPGILKAASGALTINVPAGATVWFQPELSGPVLIQYDATLIQAGGPHDRVSDLNCFWMATDARSPGNLFATKRSGAFADYNQLRTYYAGQGGNDNTTTRFRRYIGRADTRPLLPEHDLKDTSALLKPNTVQLIQLVACGTHIQYYRDGRLLFDFTDPAPYTQGRFAFRTTQSHIEIRHFRVYRLRMREARGLVVPAPSVVGELRRRQNS